MKKVTDFIVDFKYYFLGLFIIVAGICLFASQYVNINYDITRYLPSSSDTKIGVDLMDEKFEEQKSSLINVMFKDLSATDIEITLNNLKNINGVSSVDYDESSDYNKDGYTLFVVNVDDYVESETAENVYNYLTENYKDAEFSGSIYEEYKPVVQIHIIILAIAMAMVILTIMSESFVEPWLYLISIGIAVFINKGTNLMFSSVSNITDSIVAILQLALSMDYSIMLSNRFKQEKEHEKDKNKAMKNALYQSFKAISSSSVTTIVGLLALVFMSFTIGKDLGYVLAKGVLLSLLSIFCCLPGLLLLCDNLILKTKKKAPHFNLTKLGMFSYKTRFAQLVIIIVVFVVAYFHSTNLNILYTASQQDEVGKVFTANNQLAIVYKNEYEDIISNLCSELENDSNISQTLCYSNTINEKEAYNELISKFSDLGNDTEVEDYLLRIIYYNYYNKNNSDLEISLDEFIKFIKSDVYTNDDLNDEVDNETRDNIDLLENFTDKTLINKNRTPEEIASMLGIDSDNAYDVITYYNSKNLDSKMTISEFVTFMNNDVVNNNKYNSSLTNENKSDLIQLKSFTNKNIINKKYNSKDLAKIFGIDEDLVEQLFLFYNIKKDINTELSLYEFSNTALELSNDSNYSSMFSNDTIYTLTMLKNLSNGNVINKEMNASEMATLLGNDNLTEDKINLIYSYYRISNISNNTKISADKFIDVATHAVNNELTEEDRELISGVIDTINNNIDGISEYFGRAKDVIQNKYNESGATNMMEFIDYLKTDPEFMDKATKLDNIVTKVINKEEVTVDEIVDLTGISYSAATKVVEVYEDNTNYKMTPVNFVNFLLSKSDDSIISSYISDDDKNQLELASSIMSNYNNKYTYSKLFNYLSNLVDNDSITLDTIKEIYGVYDYNNTVTKLSPNELVNLILDNRNDSLLDNKLDNNTLSKLELVKTVINSTLNNTKYSYSNLAKLLGMNSSDISLVYSLYNTMYTKNNMNLNLGTFVNFLISDIVPNPTYNKSLSEDSINKLYAVSNIMNDSLNDKKYNYDSLYNILSPLKSDLEYNLIELLYVYYGSIYNYDNNYKLTIEEFINYLYNDMMHDSLFESRITEDKKESIIDGYNTVSDAKKLLVSDDYSRVVLNTKYPYESEETFNFVKNILDKISGHDGIYLAGDSAMAYEMSNSFSNELNLITILTMLFIFIVVAVTFKSLIIPFILVLIIQCAVYITESYIILCGDSVYFIALLIVQAILMGATIDYAIVYTSYYKESRLKLGVKDSIINAYNKSIITILNSASILIIVTLVVARMSTAIAAMICDTVSKGTLCAALLILFILPGILAACDKIICRKGYYKEN